MFRNLTKQGKIAIAVVCAVVVVVLLLTIVITAATKDANRFTYQLKSDDTYEITDIKNTFVAVGSARTNSCFRLNIRVNP